MKKLLMSFVLIVGQCLIANGDRSLVNGDRLLVNGGHSHDHEETNGAHKHDEHDHAGHSHDHEETNGVHKHDHEEHNHAGHSHDHEETNGVHKHGEHNHAGHLHDHCETNGGHKHDEHNHAGHLHDHEETNGGHKHDEHNHAGHLHNHCEHNHAGHVNHQSPMTNDQSPITNHQSPITNHQSPIKVSEAVQRVMGLKTVKPEKRKLQATVALTGRYELTPDARRTMATPVAGRLSILVSSLARVKKGDMLFKVESPDLSARAREIAVLEKRLEVYKKIGTANAQLESEIAVKKAEREALIGTASEKDGIVTVCATTDGVVESFPGESGAWVETGASVVRIVRPESLRLKAFAAASDVTRLADGLKAVVDGAEGEVRVGIGDESGMLPVYVIFPKGGVTAHAGARATAACVTDETVEAVTAVPTRALVKIGLNPVVFIKDDHAPDNFLAHSVTPGISAGGWTAVTGLPDDDDLEVVTDGAYELKLAIPSGDSKPAGHFHADGKFHVGEH